jgi:mannose-6-phosphate isomerase-like protein (cupin superfamily)
MNPAPALSAPATIRGADDGEVLWFRENRMIIKLTAADTHGAYGLVEAWAPAGSGPPLHVHRREEETFWVLSGRLRIRCGDHEFLARAGETALLPRDLPHAFVVEGDEPAHLLTVFTPGGGEQFFALAGRPAGGPGLPPPSPPDIPALQRAGSGLGVEILGPPIGSTRSL